MDTVEERRITPSTDDERSSKSTFERGPRKTGPAISRRRADLAGRRAFALRRSRSHFIKRNDNGGSGGGGGGGDGGDGSGGWRSRAGRGTTEKPKEKAAYKTRCESHLLFNRSIVVCVQLGLKPDPRPDSEQSGCVSVFDRGTAPLRV
ncbi:hypothetical protein EAI_12348 [Harpegnathos saltator]|uniref:Uncharacterized protein n=1 Tax=Harpegnathos saltator TaxID=610380 RepID=E2BR52_HARSA|nr:hypothetical protein EAI_12348 [Harpegnathos saltator]